MKKSIILILGIISLSTIGSCKNDTINTNIPINDTIIIQQKDTFSLNQEEVYEMLCSAQIEHPKIVLQQVILETGHFKSNACINKNNLFGFMDRNGVKTYKSFWESVQAYKSWQSVWYESGNNYYEFLDKSGYSEDSTYIDTLKKIKINV